MDVLTNLWELGLHGETLCAVDGRVFMYQATPGASNALKEVRECYNVLQIVSDFNASATIWQQLRNASHVTFQCLGSY